LSLILLLLGAETRLAISGAVVRFAYAPFFALRHRIVAGGNVFEENRQLYERLAKLQIDVQRLREAGRENTRLRELLGFLPAWEGSLIPAEVIGPITPSSGTLWIGAGSDRGLRTNWPVVTGEGLLGRVIEVAPAVSRVRTLWDRLLRVAVYDQRSRVGGVLRWEYGTHLRVHYVSRSADVQVGDTVLSSGWGGVFPKGLVVGTVVYADTTAGDEFLSVTVVPAAQSDRLEEVFVIEPVPGDSSDIEAADEAAL
jgi:rod shape-determining protein MreC